MNESESAKIAATLTVLYPNSKLADGAEAGYAMALADVPYAVVSALMPQIMDTHPTFCPGPAELRAFVKNLTSTAISWDQAWNAAMDEVRRTGVACWNGPPRFSDDAIAAAVRAIGWAAICNAPDPKFGGDARDLGFLQGRFRDAYEASVERHRRESIAAALPEPTRLSITDRGAA